MRTPFTLHHVRLTSRTSWTSWVSATTSARRCQPRQKSDEDEPRLGEEDRRAYHRCVGILRHLLLKYRRDIAFAVHEVSKTLASPEDADLRRVRRLGRYFLGPQKLGIMIRKSNDPEHLDAQTQTGVEIQSTERVLRVEHSGSDQQRLRFHEGSELSNVIERRERVLRCGDDNSRGFAPPRTSGILGNAGAAPIENRFDSSPPHHPRGKDADLLKRNTRKES